FPYTPLCRSRFARRSRALVAFGIARAAGEPYKNQAERDELGRGSCSAEREERAGASPRWDASCTAGMLETAIQDYGIIGDGRSAALVTTSGSIEWLCWPRFDSPSLFAAVLDASKGGAWRIVPRGPFRTARAYLPESNVLATTFEGPSGAVRVLDAMTAMSEEEKCTRLVPEHELLRIVEGLRGEMEPELSFAPRPDYARRLVPLREKGMLGVRLELGGDHLCTLRSDGPRRNPGTLALREDGTAIGQLTLRAGERSTFSLTFDSEAPAVLPPLGADAWDRLERTTAWWQRWVAACRY